MDRVEKALEKARQQREGGAPETSAADMPLNVVYNVTRREDVSGKTLEKGRIIASIEKDWRADAFRILRAQLLQRIPGSGAKAVGVTSAVSRDGKSLIAANLAVSLSMDVNHTVLLVDLDLRRARLAQYFGLNPKYGLTDYLLEECELNECLVNPGIDRLVMLPERGGVRNSSELLASPRMRKLMQELKNRYPDRIILCDLPPLLTSDDAVVMAPYLDATMLVVHDGKTSRSEIESSLSLLKNYNCIGTILNRSGKETNYYY